jgi:hypothetical protein
MCTVLLPPGVKPIAVNKYINTYQYQYQYQYQYGIWTTSWRAAELYLCQNVQTGSVAQAAT